MNDDVRFERLFADGLHELAPRRAPDRLRTTIKAQTGETHPRARWLALIKEPTMRSNNRVAVGSPTARVAAIMAATLLAAMMIIGAGIAGARLLAAGGPLVVDASGGGDFTSIQAAVDAADDGDEILVKPGLYAEAITIEEKDVAVRGDGPVEDVVVERGGGTLLTLTDTASDVSNLTLRGDGDTTGMRLHRGSPVVSGLVFDDVGVPYQSGEIGSGSSLIVMGGTAQVLDNSFIGGGEVMVSLDADVVMEGNEFRDGPHLYLQNPGDEAIVRGNTFSGSYDRAMGLFGESTMLIEGNTIEDAGRDGITIGWQSSPGHDPLVRDNDISGTATGIVVFAETGPVIEGNRLSGNDTGIWGQSDAATYSGNHLTGNDTGLQLRGSPQLDGNIIEDGRVGIVVSGEDSTPTLTDNTICGNEENVQISGLTNAPPLAYDDTNEIC